MELVCDCLNGHTFAKACCQMCSWKCVCVHLYVNKAKVQIHTVVLLWFVHALSLKWKTISEFLQREH